MKAKSKFSIGNVKTVFGEPYSPKDINRTDPNASEEKNLYDVLEIDSEDEGFLIKITEADGGIEIEGREDEIETVITHLNAFKF